MTTRLAPPCPKGLHEFDYTLGEVNLVCFVEFEAGCRGSYQHGLQMEPDTPDGAYLSQAFCDSQDIYELLSEKQTALIEEAFLCQDPPGREYPEPEYFAEDPN